MPAVRARVCASPSCLSASHCSQRWKRTRKRCALAKLLTASLPLSLSSPGQQRQFGPNFSEIASNTANAWRDAPPVSTNFSNSEIYFLYFYRNKLEFQLQIDLLDEMISNENNAGLVLVAMEDFPIPDRWRGNSSDSVSSCSYATAQTILSA